MPAVTEEKAEPVRRRGRYPKEFRRDAAALVIDQHRIDRGRRPGARCRRADARQLGPPGAHRPGRARGHHDRDARGERQAPPGGEAPDHGARPAQTKCGLLGEGVGPVSRYRYVSAMKAEGFPVEAACEAAEVSTSAYYDWLAPLPPAPPTQSGTRPCSSTRCTTIHERPRRHLRQPPDDRASCAGPGLCANHKRVERLMAEQRHLRQRRPTPQGPHDHPRRERPAAAGPRRSATSASASPASAPAGTSPTSRPARAGSTWPTSSISASRRIVGYAMADHMRTELVDAALSRWPSPPEVETSPAWSSTTTAGLSTWAGTSGPCAPSTSIAQSVGRIGSCQDNAVAESFWATLKRELVHRFRFATRAEARRAIIAWINHYNARPPDTPRSATCRRSSGSYSYRPTVIFKPHNHVSGWRGEGQITRSPRRSDSLTCSARSRQQTTSKNDVVSSHSWLWRFCQRRLTATPNLAEAEPFWVKRSSGSAVAFPTMVRVQSGIVVPFLACALARCSPLGSVRATRASQR